MSSRDVAIARHTVSWSVEVQLDQRAQDRLDRLALGLCGDLLEDALTVSWSAATEICIRRVDVPPTQVDWSWNDDKLLAAWAETVGAAVSKAIGAPEVIRYASRFHATVDLVLSQLAGDRTREWAWTLMELTSEASASQDAVRLAVQRTMDDEPGLVVHLIAEVARHDLLPRLVAWCGYAVLVDAAEAAWRAAGGASPGVGPAPPGGTERSAGVAPDRQSGLSPLLRAVRRRSVIWRAGASILSAVAPAHASATTAAGGGTVQAANPATALARLALVEVEPGLVPGPLSVAVLTQLTSEPRAWSDDADPQGRSAAGRAQPTTPVRGAALGADPTVEEPPAAPETDPSMHQALVARPSSVWGGLLFLLTLLDADGFAERVAADPATFGVALRAALGRLALDLLSRAAPDTTPDETDPAVLAFCGLDAKAPYPVSEGPPDWVAQEGDRLLAAIRARVSEERGAESDQALLIGVIRRRALIRVDPGWIDVQLEIDDVDVDVRMAGLDLDPGYLAWLGAVVRFRYV